MENKKTIGFTIDREIVFNEIKTVNAKMANLAGTGTTTNQGIVNAYTYIRKAHLDFQDAQIVGENFGAMNISFINLNNADAKLANFDSAVLEQATMRGADFENASFHGADMRGADLTGANLRGANFTNAYLRDVDFTGANLSGVSFVNADLKGSIIKGITYDEQTFTKSLNKPILSEITTHKV